MSDGELVVHEGGEVAINRAPEEILAEAKRAAVALTDVINGKAKKVQFNGTTYLTFEDWQTLGKFYGVTVGVDSTEYIEYGEVKGFEASATVRNVDGINVSRAEAMCLDDEPNWKKKPLFQLRSMAQTRACAKALRNVLSYVAVLAGYAGTPAEEMDGVKPKPQGSTGGAQDSAPEIKNPEDVCTDPQRKMIWAILNGMGYQTDGDKHDAASELMGKPIKSFSKLTKGEASELIVKLKEQEPPEGV